MSSFGESYAYSLGSNYRSVAEREETENANMRREHVLEQRYAFDQRQKSLNAFTSESRDFLLCESLYHIMKKCFPSTIDESLLMRGRSVVESFVQEESSTNLINQFKTKTLFLSELANIIETTHKRVLHSCDGKDAPFKITNSDMKAFHDRIDGMDIDTITKEIVSRVTKAEEEFVKANIIDADAVVFASPMYYFGISAQIKAVIDRFYAINEQIHKPKKSVLIMTYADNAAKTAQPIISHYEAMIEYLGWSDSGKIIASGVWAEGAVNNTEYPKQAYELGKNI